MIRVLVADDHHLIQQGIEALLSDTDGITLVGQASTAQETLWLYGELKPDVILMDLRLGTDCGIETAAEILRTHPEARIVALSAHGGRKLTRATYEAGMIGYIMKDAPPEQIITALLAAALPIDLSGVEKPVVDLRHTDTMPLTNREAEVFQLVSIGWSNRRVAKELGISVKTVESHLSKSYHKTGVTNRSQAALWAQRHLGPQLQNAPQPSEPTQS